MNRHPEPAKHVRDSAHEFASFVLSAFDAAPYEIDLLLGTLRTSARLNEFFGFPPEHPLTVDDCRGRYHSDDSDRMRRLVGDSIERGADAYESEFRIVLGDGTTRWGLSRGELVRDGSGAVVRARGVVLDITSRKQAERALRERESRSSLLVRVGDVLRSEHGWRGIQRAVARVLAAHFGARAAVFAEKGPDGVLATQAGHPTESADEALAVAIDAQMTGVTGAHESIVRCDVLSDARVDEALRARCRSGGVRSWMRIASKGQGALRGFLLLCFEHERRLCGHEIALLEEVAERTWEAVARARAEEALRASEARYRSLFESIDEGYCLFVYRRSAAGDDLFFLEVNPAFARQTGLAHVEGRSAREVITLQREPPWFEPLRAVVETGQPQRFEAYVDELDRWLDVYAFRVGGPGDFRVAAIFADVSGRKRAEAQLREALAAAESARAEAERANLVMNEFFARASHELRGPLGAMNMWLELLKSGRVAHRTKAIDAIERSVRRQGRLVADLLDVARALVGKLRVDREKVDLLLAVETTVLEFEPEARARAIDLEFRSGDEILYVEGDLVRLQQAVANLLSNAIKFSREGGTIEVTVERGRDGHGLVHVRDGGKGISPEFLPRVFKPYQQEDGSLTRAHGGLGLGLAIVKQIVDLHGGSVWVESAGEGLGARFTASLPLVELDETAPRDKADGGASPSALKGLRVLVVDDDDVLRAGVVAALAHREISVCDAPSAESALALLMNERFDVVLCDLAMPEHDGFWLVRALRALGHDRGAETPVVAFTGQTRDADRHAVLAAGFVAHVTKPVSLGELYTVLERVHRSACAVEGAVS